MHTASSAACPCVHGRGSVTLLGRQPGGRDALCSFLQPKRKLKCLYWFLVFCASQRPADIFTSPCLSHPFALVSATSLSTHDALWECSLDWFSLALIHSLTTATIYSPSLLNTFFYSLFFEASISVWFFFLICFEMPTSFLISWGWLFHAFPFPVNVSHSPTPTPVLFHRFQDIPLSLETHPRSLADVGRKDENLLGAPAACLWGSVTQLALVSSPKSNDRQCSAPRARVGNKRVRPEVFISPCHLRQHVLSHPRLRFHTLTGHVCLPKWIHTDFIVHFQIYLPPSHFVASQKMSSGKGNWLPLFIYHLMWNIL